MYSSSGESNICQDRFWDSNLTWHTPTPDFTQCFQQTVFVLVPCITFCFAAALNLGINWKQTRNISLPWTPLNISKLVLCSLLICTSIVQLGFASDQKVMDSNIPDIDLYTACIRVVTYVLAAIIMIRNLSIGKKSSTLLVLFWLIMTACSVVLFRSTILRTFHEKFSLILQYKYIPEMMYFPVLFCLFFLSLFPDKTTGIPLEEKSPFEDAPFFSFLTFYWFNSIIYKGKKKLLAVDDFPPLPSKIEASYLWAKFQTKWNKELKKVKPGDNTGELKNSMPRIGWTLIRTFWPWLLCSGIYQVIDSLLLFVAPLLLDQLITFIINDEYIWKGYLYSITMVLSDFISGMSYNFMMYYSECFALQLQTTISSTIYRKSLKLSSSSRRKYTTGEIVNLISVDVEKIYNFCTYCTMVIGGPLRLTLTIVFLWMYLGPSCLAGVAVLCILVGFTSFLSKKVNYLQERQMETKDFRIKFMTEILNGIKVLKLYAWELPFMKKISEIRLKEVKLTRSFHLCFATFNFFWGSVSFLVAVSSFVTYVLIDENHVLSPNVVFVSLNLLNILRYTVLEVPIVIADAIQTMVSVKRITNFLASEEQCENEVGNSPDHGEVISVRNAIFSWGLKDEPALKNIDFHVPKGYLIAIIGPVGSGKSSLLSAILGEMYKISGSIDLKGSVAYVPQQAWILNQTLRENILFVKPMNRKKYDVVLDSCCLKPDLEILPARDNTEIGEKGVNLSGGQKQRISLARSVYHEADIYLLDDPLSAVDAHVGKHIFEHVIGPNGLLKNKTRILVTHNISILPETDYIITMKDGTIQEKGTYDELMDCKELFYEIIKEYSDVKNTSEDSELTDVLPEANAPSGLYKLTTRSISSQSRERTVSIDSKTIETDGRLTEEEWMEVGKVKKEAYISYAKNMGFKILFVVAMGYFSHQVLEIGGNIWLSKWSSDPPPVNGTQDVSWRNLRIGVYSLIGFFQGVSVALGSISLAFGAAQASKHFHSLMLQSVMKSPMTFFDTTPLGRIINRFGRDMDDIDTGFPSQIDGWLACLFSVIGTFCVVGASTPLFLPCLIPLGILYYFIQKWYLITSRQLKRLTSTTRSPVYSHLSESIQGSSSINAYEISEHFIQKAEQKMNTNCLCQFMWVSCVGWLNVHLTVIGDIIILLAAILAVVSKDHLDAATVGLSVTYALSVTGMLTWLIRTGTDMENKSVSIERVMDYSKLPSEAPWNVSDTYPPPSWPTMGKIEFKHYSTRYRENLDLVLDDINLEIKECEKVGIVGRTGAGKSSFALAVFRIIEPVTGTIDIDDVDISQIGLHQLRSKLTIIPQDPVLFTGPLRTNLDPNEDYSDEDLWWSLEHANLKTFVSSLPEGLAYDVAEGGSNLSVGQRQLICLARALLKKTKILILDEATAAVDVETDHLIQNTIRNEFKDHTVLTIAHRLNTILDYDKVLVMEAGKISEIGNPAELLQRENTLFYSMAKDAGLV